MSDVWRQQKEEKRVQSAVNFYHKEAAKASTAQHSTVYER